MMPASSEERAVRTAPWLVVCATMAALLFASGLVAAVYASGLSRMSLGFAALSVVGILGLVDTLTRSVVLGTDHLRVVSFWSKRVYKRAEIESVKWEGGVGVALKLASGGWARLPELGRNSQSVSNTIRAWLKRTEPGSAS